MAICIGHFRQNMYLFSNTLLFLSRSIAIPSCPNTHPSRWQTSTSWPPIPSSTSEYKYDLFAMQLNWFQFLQLYSFKSVLCLIHILYLALSSSPNTNSSCWTTSRCWKARSSHYRHSCTSLRLLGTSTRNHSLCCPSTRHQPCCCCSSSLIELRSWFGHSRFG